MNKVRPVAAFGMTIVEDCKVEFKYEEDRQILWITFKDRYGNLCWTYRLKDAELVFK